MNNSKTYRVASHGDGESDHIPSVAVFVIDEQAARQIIMLSAQLKELGLRRIEKSDPRPRFLRPVAGEAPESAGQPVAEHQVETECDALVVDADGFFYSAYIAHTADKVWCEGQSISQLKEHFGLSDCAQEPVRIVIGVEEGAVVGVSSDAPLNFLVYNYDVDVGSDAAVVTRPAMTDGEVEVHETGWVAAQLVPEKVVHAHALAGPRKPGRIWWIADSSQEAEDWRSQYLAKGAISVELKARNDATGQLDVIFTVDRDRANEIMGYEVDREEFLID